MIGGVPTAPVHSSPLFDSVQKNIALTGSTNVADGIWTNPQVLLDTNTFAGSLQWLLDNELKIGGTTLPDMIDKNSSIHLGTLLGGSGLGTSSTMTDVFDKLGLSGFQMGALMGGLGLGTSTTVDGLLSKMGMGTMALDTLLKDLGFTNGSHETVDQLLTMTGMQNMSVSQLLTAVGMPGTTTVDGLLTNMGLGNLTGLLGAMGVTSSTNLTNLIGLMGSGAGSLTLGQLLGPAGSVAGTGFLSTIGSMTFGQLLGFTSTTTLGSVVDGLHFSTAWGSASDVGEVTLKQLIGLVAITPSMTLSQLLGDLPLGVGSSTDLGHDTLGQFLTAMTSDPNTMTVTDATSVHDLLTDIGLGSLSLDALIGLPTA